MSFKEIFSVYCEYHKECVNRVHRKMQFSLGAFVKLRKATIDFVMSVGLYVCLFVLPHRKTVPPLDIIL